MRKPGASENGEYQEAMFPGSRFRMAYDVCREATPGRAAEEQLKILELAARENKSLAEDALRALLDTAQPVTAQAVVDGIERHEPAWPVTDV